MAKILIIDDNPSMRDGMVLTLERCGHQCLAAKGGREGLQMFDADTAVELVLSDLRMDDVDGMQVVKHVVASGRNVPVILITAYASVEDAVAAMSAGASDYLTKPVDADELSMRVSKSLQMKVLERENVRLKAETDYLRQKGTGFGDELLGKSEPMLRIIDQIKKVASTDATVFIGGESGTGKELVARMIHQLSSRNDRPFVVANCSAFAETLLESELFGHEKGSFSGATNKHAGRIELADSGTLFLDEIGDISPSVQVKLLRVLQERCFERVGGEKTISVNVRIVSATNRDLRKMVNDGKFRDDLFYRLHIVPIYLPPLRERRDDIALLADTFIQRSNQRLHRQVTSITEEALRVLQAHSWPGNVRELENVLEYAMVMNHEPVLRAEHLPPLQRLAAGPGPDARSMVGSKPLPDLLDGIEREMIEEAMRQSHGNRSEAARLLGLKTGAFFYKLEKYGLNRN